MALDLLRGHVVDRPHDAPRLGQLGSLRRFGALGDPEVGQVGVVAAPEAAQQDVPGLDVAVGEAGRVRGVERAAHLLADRGDALERQGAVLDRLGEVGALDPLHGDVGEAVDLAGGVHGDHIGMVDRGGEVGLALEAGAEVGLIAHLRRDHLERDETPQRDLARAIDDPHAPAPGFLEDLEVAESFPITETRSQGGHRMRLRGSRCGRGSSGPGGRTGSGA